jgi:hypothetical protein
MKQILTLLLTFNLLAFSNAQTTLFEEGFENWSSLTGYEEPTDWLTSNFLYGFLIPAPPATVLKSTDAAQGAFAAKLVAVDINDSTRIRGFMLYNIPFTQRPTNISGSHKFTSNGDTLNLTVFFSKFDPTGDTSATIGGYGIQLTETVSNYTNFSAPIQYQSSETPDSLTIFISSTDQQLSSGFTYFIDNLKLEGPAGIFDATNNKSLGIYPNPCNQSFILPAQKATAIVRLNDVSGKLIQEVTLIAGEREIATSQLANGVYFVELNVDNVKIGTQRIVVAH